MEAEQDGKQCVHGPKEGENPAVTLRNLSGSISSQGGHNKLPSIERFTTESYSLSVLEARSLPYKCQQGGFLLGV